MTEDQITQSNFEVNDMDFELNEPQTVQPPIPDLFSSTRVDGVQGKSLTPRQVTQASARLTSRYLRVLGPWARSDPRPKNRKSIQQLLEYYKKGFGNPL
ncbi:hypothetical protein JTE90_007082 [Oedothorax gibbosus]|uniref:Uncharacterized protein n=1 Tax=Oedothorax gibbosus TaxID=931172 RepID=A0AAV6VPX7_9ARAC|nr:hypothetical protein JTE90_007082 [Oedothorax gibbosus]